mmetsp:Transcript_4285/g.7306  ORF Transcript_4285/g.7306 Transcript_4285/m.7306 type:complete len:644 (+) Transcript_4285:442-2373(+)
MPDLVNLPHIGESPPSRRYNVTRNVQAADSSLMFASRGHLHKVSKRCAYPYRDTSGFKMHQRGQTTAPEAQPEATTSAEEGDDKQGHHYRFYFKKDLPTFGHMDVYCPWDKDDPNLDISGLAYPMRYAVRMRFSRTKRSQKLPMDEAHDWFKKVREASEIDIDALTKFVENLTPRSVSDMKPMNAMLQGVLHMLLTRQNDLLNRPLLDEIAQLKRQLAEFENLKKQSQVKLAVSDQWRGLLTAHMNVLKQHKESGAAAIREQSALETEYHRLKSAEEDRGTVVLKIDQLRKQAEVAKHQLKDAVKVRHEADAEKAVALKELAGRNKEIVQHKRREIELKNLVAKEVLKNAVLVTQEHQSTSSLSKIAMERQLSFSKVRTGLRTQIDTLHVKANAVPFLPWAVYGPVMEYEWAARLTLGLTTVSMPPASVITLPASGDLPWHVADIPAGSIIVMPHRDSADDFRTAITADAALPWNAQVTFPDDQEYGELTVPGGTSLVLPDLPFVVFPEEGESKQEMFTITITQGTILHLKKEGEEAPNQGGVGGEASVTSGLLPGPSDAEHEMTSNVEVMAGRKANEGEETPSNTEIVGGAKASSREVPGGTTITTPFGVRSTVTVPTKTRLMVPNVPNRTVRMPGGSTVLL